MDNTTELQRLEQFVDKLLNKYNQLKADYLSLQETLRERDAECADLKNNIANLSSERTEVGSRVAGLLDRIVAWESEAIAGRPAARRRGCDVRRRRRQLAAVPLSASQSIPMQDRLVRFHLFGQEFTFYSDASEDEVEAIIDLLRQELEGGETVSRSAVPSSKILVLGCLRMTARYVQLQREYQDFRQTEQRTLAELAEKVRVVLD
jgi:Cell division protein ZapA.